jgi:hypothetical protein
MFEFTLTHTTALFLADYFDLVLFEFSPGYEGAIALNPSTKDCAFWF